MFERTDEMCECDEGTQEDQDRTEERRMRCVRDFALLIAGVCVLSMYIDIDPVSKKSKQWVNDTLIKKYDKETVEWVRKNKSLVMDEMQRFVKSK